MGDVKRPLGVQKELEIRLRLRLGLCLWSLALPRPVVLTDGRRQEDLMLEDSSSGQATVYTEGAHFNPQK